MEANHLSMEIIAGKAIYDQVLKDLNMKEQFGKIKQVISGFAIIIVSVCIFWFCYIPFCKFNQIGELEEIETQSALGTYLKTWQRFQDYCNILFLAKGTTFNNILCSGKDNTIYNVDIKFNWDNTISVHIDDKYYSIIVDSVCISPSLREAFGVRQPIPGSFISVDHIASSDSAYMAVDFYDNKRNVINLFRQPESLPYEGQRYGFYLNLNNCVFKSGRNSFFDY